MWSLVLLLLACLNQVESQADENRLILMNGSNPCEGHVWIYHNKQWGYIGAKTLSHNDKKVVCRSTRCGEPNSTSATMRPLNGLQWLRELKCNGSEDYLWNCPFTSWDASRYRSQTVEKITCTHTIQLSLEFPCGGVVRYSDGQNPSGYICGDTWSEKEGAVVCRNLDCGNVKEIPNWSYSMKMNTITSTSCLGNENHLWECAPKKPKSCSKPAVVYCEDHKLLRLKTNNSNVCSGTLEMKNSEGWMSVPNQHNKTTLNRWCRQMYCGSYVSHTTDASGTQLTCSDEVRVVLRHNDKPRCYGTVHIEVNGTLEHVCGSMVDKEYNLEVICKQLGCGSVSYTVIKKSRAKDAIMDLVSCANDDPSLWYCKAKHSQEKFKCDKEIYLICSESIKVELKDGPGRCAGRLEIFYEDQWQKVYATRWDEEKSTIVCKELGCGEAENQKKEKFTKGPSNFLDKHLTCPTDSETISKCKFKDGQKTQNTDEETVSITCTGHKDVFLSEGFCRGNVGIQTSKETHWLSADRWSKTFADVVCGQMRCGTADTFTNASVKSNERSIWNTSDCPSEFKSVFDCTYNTSGPSVHNTGEIKVAHVNCTGNKTMYLNGTCWGVVNICEEGHCGKLCGETWTDDQAKMLCQQLGCGDHVVPVTKEKETYIVDFKSVHLLKDNDLTKFHIVKRNSNDNSCNGNGAYVICSGSLKSRFDQPKDSCSGNVQLSKEDKWLPVCEGVLKDNGASICAQLNCGDTGQPIAYYGQNKNTDHVSKLLCQENSKSVHLCNKFDIKFDNGLKCPLSGLRCSNWKQMVLVNGEDACSGVVFVYSKDNRDAVSSAGWTDKESARLCEDLSCGKEGTMEVKPHFTDVSFWKQSFNCTGVEKPQNIWDCKKTEPPTENKQLFIKCSNSPTVKLTQGCQGEVLIDDVEVCSTGWVQSYSDLVCQEMKCTSAVDGDFNTLEPQSQNEYQHVSCEEHHDHLGQCRRFKGTCKDKLVTVFCSVNVKVNTTFKCGGEIEVSFQDGIREKACFREDLSSLKITENLCKKLGCGEPDKRMMKSHESNNNKEMVILNATLTCTKDDQDIRYCVSKTKKSEKCERKPAQIFCNGYVKPEITPEPRTGRVVPIVLSLGLILILVIGVFVFLRFYLIRKNKSIKDILPRFSKKKEEEFESGEYEDMPSKEMEDINSHGLHVLTSETEKEGSASSLAYDDVDEICETQPLTSEDPMQTKDNELDYEVEDPTDSYDDIDASSEIVQTAAEVHVRPSSVEDTGEAPPDLVLGDDDYLVPVENV